MFAADDQIFDAQLVSAAVAIAAETRSHAAQLRHRKPEFIVSDCQQIESGSEPGSAERSVDPAGLLSIMAGTPKHPIAPDKVKVQLIRGPAHGALKSETSNTGYRFYAYHPSPGYIGKDQLVFVAEADGKIYKVIVTVAVVRSADDHPDQTICPSSDIRRAFLPAI